jgi:hypothetical protein
MKILNRQPLSASPVMFWSMLGGDGALAMAWRSLRALA